MDSKLKIVFDLKSTNFSQLSGGQVVGHDAVWLRWFANDGMQVINWLKAARSEFCAYAFLLDNDHFSEKKSEPIKKFLGAFGKNNLLNLNKEKIFRYKINFQNRNLYLDCCKLSDSLENDVKNFINIIFNEKFGFLAFSRSELTEMQIASIGSKVIGEKNLTSIFNGLIDGGGVAVALPVENDEVVRSLVVFGDDLILQSHAFLRNEDVSNLEESISVFGDRLIGARVIENSKNGEPC